MINHLINTPTTLSAGAPQADHEALQPFPRADAPSVLDFDFDLPVGGHDDDASARKDAGTDASAWSATDARGGVDSSGENEIQAGLISRASAGATPAPATNSASRECEERRTAPGVDKVTPPSPEAGSGPSTNHVPGPSIGGLLDLPATPPADPRPSSARQSSIQTPATDAEWREAQAKAVECEEFQRQRTAGHSLTEAARIVGRSPSWFSGADSPFARWTRDGVAGLLPRRGECGARPTVFPDLPDWFIPAANFFYRRLNRTSTAGSAPEAIRRTISLPACPPNLTNALARTIGIDPRPTRSSLCEMAPELPACPPELRNAILAREREGKDLLPERLMRQVNARAPVVQAIRSPRDAWLRYVESPGSLMIDVDEDGVERFLEPGEMGTIDDGTINFACTVALDRPGDPCWDKFGVIVGRFQFLLAVDHRSYFITGFSYTARPRSSYRAEDLVATLHTTFREHGRWPRIVLENGISAANLVTDCLRAADVKILRARSPHQKVVEFVFNKLWTKLSLERGQVGRYRGEEEETNRLLTNCRTGGTDPRKHFPPLADVLRALREAIAAYNSGVVNGRYGRWVPAEYFAAHARKHMRPLEPGTDWMFSPVIAGPLKVRTLCMKTSVPLLPGFSQSFAFCSEELAHWHGARVKLYFNPLAPECRAKIVLAEDWRGIRGGTVICDATQIDRTASYTRRLLEYGPDQDAGLLASRKLAASLRRVAQAVKPDGTATAPVEETRDGTAVMITEAARVRMSEPATPPENVTPIDRATRQRDLEEFERQNAALFG